MYLVPFLVFHRQSRGVEVVYALYRLRGGELERAECVGERLVADDGADGVGEPRSSPLARGTL